MQAGDTAGSSCSQRILAICQPFEIEARKREEGVAGRFFVHGIRVTTTLVETKRRPVGQDRKVAVGAVAWLEAFVHRPRRALVVGKLDGKILPVAAATGI